MCQGNQFSTLFLDLTARKYDRYACRYRHVRCMMTDVVMTDLNRPLAVKLYACTLVCVRYHLEAVLLSTHRCLHILPPPPPPPARIERIHMHASIMADTQSLQRCKHKKGACNRCDSGICSSCCKCVKPKGRPRNILRDIELIRVNVTRNARPSLEFLSLEYEIPDYEFVEPVYY